LDGVISRIIHELLCIFDTQYTIKAAEHIVTDSLVTGLVDSYVDDLLSEILLKKQVEESLSGSFFDFKPAPKKKVIKL
jgi:hypothetical protein